MTKTSGSSKNIQYTNVKNKKYINIILFVKTIAFNYKSLNRHIVQ